MFNLRVSTLTLAGLVLGSSVGLADIRPDQGYVYAQRADILIETLTGYYGAKIVTGTDQSTLTIQALSCSQAAGSDPSCTVTIAGVDKKDPVFKAYKPAANLFQILIDAGAGRVDAQHPGVILAGAKNLVCTLDQSYSYPSNSCLFDMVLGRPAPAAAPAVVHTQGYHAARLLGALEQGGSPDISQGQYGQITKLDSLSCSSKIVYGDNSGTLVTACTAKVGDKVITITDKTAEAVYTALAEAGAASWDKAQAGYVANVSALYCDFGSTHTSGGEEAVCDFTVAKPSQVVTHVAYLTSTQTGNDGDTSLSSLWQSLLDFGVPVQRVSNASIITLDGDCVKASIFLPADCQVRDSSGNALKSSDIGNDTVYGALSPQGTERIVLGQPGETQAFGSVSCITQDNNVGEITCVARIQRVAPLL